MDKGKLALGVIALLVILQGMAWMLNKDGALTVSVCLIIGSIAGALFGFSVRPKT